MGQGFFLATITFLWFKNGRLFNLALFMKRKQIIGGMLKEGASLARKILFPAPWMARKLFFLWWLTMERDLENPEDKKVFSSWLSRQEKKALPVASVIVSMLLGVGCFVGGYLLIWYGPVRQPGTLPWPSIWLGIWGLCSGAHAIVIAVDTGDWLE